MKLTLCNPKSVYLRLQAVFRILPCTTPFFSAALILVGLGFGESQTIFGLATATDISNARIFDEPLVPLGSTVERENQVLASALQKFIVRKSNDDASALEQFIKGHSKSPWNASLLCNLGLLYYHTGYFSKALSAWEESWQLSKNQSDPYGKSIGDRSLGELAKMNARLGRIERLETLMKEIEGRNIQGPATAKVQGAREGLWLMNNLPEEAFRCGPLALDRILEFKKPHARISEKILNSKSTRKGISLWNVYQISKEAGLNLRIAKRRTGSELLVPAVVNWKVGHYAAIVERADGLYHVQDPTFGDDLWISQKALELESSGYFLVQNQNLPAGWTPVEQNEAEKVWGKGSTSSSDPGGTKPSDNKSGGDGCGKGMPTYAFHTMLVSLNIVDVPLGYTPPRGPAVDFRITYNQGEANQPSIFSYSNLGNKWTIDWISYLTDDPSSPAANVNLFVKGGGTEIYMNYNSATMSFAPAVESQAVLVRTSSTPINYERRMPDGSKEIFSVPNGATSFPRKVFLSKIIDSKGQILSLTYDGKMRLVSVKDALGQVTTLTYGLSSDSLKITKVTDPFGRFTTLNYNSQGQFQSITDEAGLVSQFTYGQNDFIKSLTTPYGSTTFLGGDRGSGLGGKTSRWLQATDPLGQKERLEFQHYNANVTDGAPYPTGILDMSGFAGLYHESNSIFWGKKAMAEAPGDIKSGTLFQWLRSTNPSASSNILGSTKKPLENRLWFNYVNQASAITIGNLMAKPVAIGRVLDDGTTQLYRNEYNNLGKITKAVDPLGRTDLYSYSPDSIDVISIRHKNGTQSDLLDTIAYNSQHLPLSITDAAGQKTSYTYNSNGQMLTRVNPRGERTTFVYNTNGYMTKSFGPTANDTTKYTYDTFGRENGITYPDGFKVTTIYDNLDRPTKVTYPDGTFEQYIYDKLDVGQIKDRLGRWTKMFYNANRHLVAVRDPLGRMTNMEWCGCGSMATMTDPNGNSTTWKRDIQGRLQEKQFADGRKISYAYESSTSRLKSITDSKSQVANYGYFLDDNLKQEIFTNTIIPTHTASYAYDSVYNRLNSMIDSLGTTNYAYYPVTVPAALGARALKSIDGPWSNDSILFSYDSLGRECKRTVNGAADSVSYDSLGRVSSNTNALGRFGFKYVGSTNRFDSLINPKNQKVKYTYYTSTGDFRLKDIINLNSLNTQLSKFTNTYNAEGQILTWTQQWDKSTASIHTLNYDAVDQLLGDIVKSAASGNPVLKQYGYGYDKMGNRTNLVQDSTETSL